MCKLVGEGDSNLKKLLNSTKVFDYVQVSIQKITRKVVHGNIKELLWTILPTIILVLIAVPSLHLLYSMDSVILSDEPVYTFKVIGHQWFWSYEYFGMDSNLINYTSYMLDEDSLAVDGLRLLEVD